MRTFTGYVPDNIKYVQRQPREVSDYWEHDWLTPEELRRKGILVAEAFPVDSKNKKTLETAMSWARRRNYHDKGPVVPPKVTEVPNDPIPTVEIVSLDIRSEGGRAWKVLIHGTYYVDLREDVFLDTLRNGTGVIRGELSGPFVWCSVGSHMKLVRVGSKLHDAVLAAGVRRDSKNVTGGALELGCIYQNRKGEKFVYLGLVDSDRYEFTNEKESRYRGYGNSSFVPHYKVIEERGFQLWGEIRSYWKSPQDLFKVEKRDSQGSAGTNIYSITTVKKKIVVGKTGTMKLPPDVIEKARKLALLELQTHDAHMKTQREERKKTGNHWTYGPVEDFEYACYLGGKCTYREAGQPLPDVPELAALNAYIAKQPPEPIKVP